MEGVRTGTVEERRRSVDLGRPSPLRMRREAGCDGRPVRRGGGRFLSTADRLAVDMDERERRALAAMEAGIRRDSLGASQAGTGIKEGGSKVDGSPFSVRSPFVAIHSRYSALFLLLSDHDELRFSLRSTLKAFTSSSLRQLHLLTADLPANTLHSDILGSSHSAPNRVAVVNSSRIGQVPTWFKPSSSPPSLSISHHADIFEDPAALPAFNSRSIEAQIPNLDSLSEFLLYLNASFLPISSVFESC
jgi:hypothetical protein